MDAYLLILHHHDCFTIIRRGLKVITSSLTKRAWAALFCLLLPVFAACGTSAIPGEQPATVSQLDVKGRSVDVWHWPARGTSKDVILFSHGAASAPWKYEALIGQWTAAGYDVYAPLHVDSTDHPRHDDFKGMASWKARLEDVSVLADEIGKDGYITAGHSYGGLVALTRGGAKALVPDGFTEPMADPRVKLVLAFSPPAAIPGFIEKEAYAGVSVPALVQTGTMDIPPGTDVGWQGHLDAYAMAQPGGHRYALVLEGVDHYFGGAICRPELPGPKQTGELDIAAEISLLMIEAFAADDEGALGQLQARLSNEGPVELVTK